MGRRWIDFNGGLSEVVSLVIEDVVDDGRTSVAIKM